MRILKTTLLVAWFVNVAVLLVFVLLDITTGRQPSDLFLGIAGGTWCLSTALLFLVEQISSESGSVVLGAWLSTGALALGVVFLSAAGVLPDFFRAWAAGAFLTWFAVMFVGFWMVKLAAERAAEREARKENQVSASTPQSTSQADNGWTTPQLALVLMFFGVVTILIAIKCLVFGPPPYSRWAYVIGPVLVVAGYLVDPGAIRYLLNEWRKPTEPPAAEVERESRGEAQER